MSRLVHKILIHNARSMQKTTSVFVRYLALIAVAVGVFAVGYYSAPALRYGVPTEMATSSETVHLLLFDGTGKVSTFREIPYHTGMTVADMLQTLSDEKQLTLQSKDYGAELGVFIESINGVGKGNTSAWWQFWVNGRYGNMGVSQTVLQPGDQIVFALTTNQQ